MKFLCLFCLAVLHFGSAQADTPFGESPRLVLQAIAQGRTVQGLASAGQVSVLAIAVPYRMEAEDCIGIGLIRIASALIENWRLCGGRLERLPGISPQLSPGNPQMKEMTDWAVQEAARLGQKQTGWGDYEILARRLPDTDPNACQPVESLILFEGLLVSRQVTHGCR